LLEETFRYETPDVVVFNVLSMKYDTPASTGRADQREAYNRMTLDGMRWSLSKWNAIRASMTDMEKEKEGMWLYLFPLLRYHDRWSELTQEDVTYLLRREPVSDNGYLMQVGIRGVSAEHVEKPLIDYTFSDICWEYLEKMRLLCEQNGSRLVLIKAPSLSPVWWEQWDAQIEGYAAEHDLLYVNFLDHQDAIGIDWTVDTYDTGLHLNVYGAEKLTAFFGEILAAECGLEDRRTDAQLSVIWQEKADIYEARKTLLEAQRDATN